MAVGTRTGCVDRGAETSHVDLGKRAGAAAGYCIPVGETVPVHTHKWPGVYHTIQFSHFIRRDGEGKLLFDSRTVTGDRPGAAFLENLPPHSVENVGDCDIHLISVELKG
jgi:quercetin dioxygenase-like cupin family protein